MAIELLSPAGNPEKLETAFAYGADAAYMGLSRFSLRANADNFGESDRDRVAALKRKTGKRLYCALNILFHESQMDELKGLLPSIAQWPFDAFIVSDLGTVPLLRKTFGDGTALHLSTQATCLNAESAAVYRDLGFSRIILGREASLDDIRRIKDAVPDMELEVFVHGAMCMAYSGRCLLSSHLAGRSGNQGDCAHTCRWYYRMAADDRLEKLLAGDVFALEESQRPGIYYPISEENGYTTILSSKDLCMIDHLADLADAGVDSVKIEGRMKSTYYVAIVTRAYRKALDALSGKTSNWLPYRNELMNISHREYSTGFFYGHGTTETPREDSIDESTECGYLRDYLFCGIIGREVRPGIRALEVKNQIRMGQTLEYIGSDVLAIPDTNFRLLDGDFAPVAQADHGKIHYLQTDKPVREGYIIRRENMV